MRYDLAPGVWIDLDHMVLHLDPRAMERPRVVDTLQYELAPALEAAWDRYTAVDPERAEPEYEEQEYPS